MGIPITYDGDGETTKVTFKYLKQLPKIAIGVKRVINDQMKNIDQFREKQLKKYEIYNSEHLENKNIKQIENIWKEFMIKEFFINEERYLLQVYINTIKENDLKKELLKIIDYGEYLNVLSGIQNLSHTRPLKKECEIIKKIMNNNEILKYWKTTNESQILIDYIKNKEGKYFEGINEYINECGYHSNSDLDLTVAPYYYDIKSIIVRFKNNIKSENIEILLKNDLEKNNLYNNVIDKLRKKLSKGKFLKIEKKIIELKKFLWWREELKDLSNRYYSLVKKYTHALAQKYYEEKIIKEKIDIHYLKYTDILDYIDKKITKDDICFIVDKNKKYCKSFVNFRNPNDIGRRYEFVEKVKNKNCLKGIGCSEGIKTGEVRIVEDISDINKVKKGEILVTKFIDTGWISRFGILNGVVSEYGGTLCHSSIVAKEYGIPVIVGVENVEKIFNNGEIIEINGGTGEIRRI